MTVRAIEVLLLTVLLLAIPHVGLPIACGAHGALAPAHAQAERSGSHSSASGCGADVQDAPHFTTGCSACGAALLPEQILLPTEAFWSYESPAASLTMADPLSSYWHPPA